ncbi:uncharacterized protein LOC125903885 [Epinephelus fuscoguttatus]|uniref:uncharacterized protein LOC125903885 n=1 Tax=Epinephelus fuscoguttatus TaxID=293821 RepID=UPI0020D0E3BC|nr:uncharacterized protein LOC125903885 [Epinephelus fuscoguttatus]
MGIKAVDSHFQSGKHKDYTRARQQTPIARFCSTLPTASKDVTTKDVTVGNPQPTSSSSDIRTACGSTPTLRAEVIWVLRTVTSHHSYRSNEGIEDVFKAMFPDSVLVQTFTCGRDKTRYVAKFGLAPHIKKQLIAEVNMGPFVIMFDETLNQTTKSKQLDLHVRYWRNDHVQSRYYGSQFMGHATAQDLLQHFKECVQQLDLRNMISISMDGPSVNWKFFDLLQQEQAEEFGGAKLTMVGSCGLHTLHNAFKSGFSVWQLEKVLKALHTVFHNTPAQERISPL